MAVIDSNDAALRLLAWYAAMGADAAVADTAVDWLARGDAAPKPPPRPEPPGAGARPAHAPAPPAQRPAAIAPPAADRGRSADPRAASPKIAASPKPPPPPAAPASNRLAVSPDIAVAAAKAAAANAATLDALAAALNAFDGCGLKATAKSLCFYRGAPKARLMVIGEAPGRDEDLAGQPFQGDHGALLDAMLAAIGLSPADCHIGNAVYWRPPGNRTPTPQELDVCRPFLTRQVELVEPTVLLLLGTQPARQMLDTAETLIRMRGRWQEVRIGARPLRAMATYTPAYLIKMPAHKQYVWRDLLAVKAALAGARL